MPKGLLHCCTTDKVSSVAVCTRNANHAAALCVHNVKATVRAQATEFQDREHLFEEENAVTAPSCAVTMEAVVYDPNAPQAVLINALA